MLLFHYSQAAVDGLTTTRKGKPGHHQITSEAVKAAFTAARRAYFDR